MAADTSTATTGNMGFILTGITFLWSRISISDVSAFLACCVATVTLIINWPKFRTRLQQIFKRKTKK